MDAGNGAHLEIETLERPASDESLERMVRLLVALDPLAHDLTTAGMRRWEAMTHDFLQLLVHADGEDVGVAGIYGAPYDPGSATYPCQLLVQPGHWDSGLADTLAERLASWARARSDQPTLSVGVEAGSAGFRFWTARGLLEADRYAELELQLDDDLVLPPANPGVEIVSLAERLDLQRALWQLQCDTWHDMPGEASAPPPYDAWMQHFDEGRRPLGGALVALDAAGAPVGMTLTGVDPESPAKAWTSFSAVRREARGTGIATALKIRQLEWCRRSGIRTITTGNHLGNAPMLAINARFGFRESRTVLQLQGMPSTP